MKKLVALFLAFFVSNPCHALQMASPSAGVYSKTAAAGVNRSAPNKTTLQRLQELGGLTFYKDFSYATVPADYSAGSGVGTETSTRTGANVYPGSYVNSSGVFTSQPATNNTTRFTWYTYDESGIVATKGLLREQASTNLITYSHAYENAAWTKTNVTASDSSIASPDGTVNASTLTASADDGTVILASAVTAQTYSVFLKRKTGTGKIYITSNGGTTWAEIPVHANWARFQTASTSASQTCGIKISTNGDAVYAWVSQFENVFYSTTAIPTTGTALTRNIETLTYLTESNRTSANETVIAKFIPTGGNFVEGSGNSRSIIRTSTKERRIGQDAFINQGYVTFNPNYTDQNTLRKSTSDVPQVGNSYVVGGSCVNSPSAYKVYSEGVKIGTTGSSAWTENAWGETFSVGGTTSSSMLNGVVQQIAIYSRAITDSEMATVSAVFTTSSDNSVSYPRYIIVPIGDSITYGANSTTGFGYRYNLQVQLLAFTNTLKRFSRIKMAGTHNDGFSDTSYPNRHSGISGEIIGQISARVPANLNYFYTTSQPGFTGRQMFLIHAGTNNVTITAGGDYTSTIGQYQAMLDTILAYNPNIEIYCALIIPRKDAKEVNNVTFNGLLQTMLQTYQATHPTVHIVDLHSAFLANVNWATEYYDTDSLHPIDAGYDVMGQVWANCINDPTSQYCDGH